MRIVIDCPCPESRESRTTNRLLVFSHGGTVPTGVFLNRPIMSVATRAMAATKLLAVIELSPAESVSMELVAGP
jgi:hypothetical protein